MDTIRSFRGLMTAPIIRIIPIALLLLFAACSGGGGGGGDAATRADKGSIGGTGDGGNEGTPPPGWDTIARVGTPRDTYYYDLYQPSVAIDGAGRAIAVWVEEYRGGTSDLPRVWANRYESGAWGTAFQLSPDLAVEPAVILNAAGQGAAVYIQRETDPNGNWNEILWARRYVNGAWEAAERVSHDTAEPYGMYAFDPQVGVDANGTVFAAWRQSDSTASDLDGVWVSRHDGTGWSAPLRLDTIYSAYAEGLALSVGSGGAAVVAWIENTNPYDPGQVGGGPMLPNTWVIVYDNGWQTAEKIGNPDLAGFDTSTRLSVSVNADGDAAVAWEEHTNANGHRIMESRFDTAGGGWTTAAPLDTSTDYLNWPAAAMDGSGNVTVVWSAEDPATGITNGVLRHYDALADTWSTAVAFETADDDVEDAPRADAAANGDVWIGWLQSNQMHSRRYVPGTGLDAPATHGSANDFALDVSGAGFVAQMGLRVSYSTNPVGFFEAPWVTVCVP